jgi:hypothetical protein
MFLKDMTHKTPTNHLPESSFGRKRDIEEVCYLAGKTLLHL